jgi:membrane protein YdbS with pleckstrin-like domain
MKNNGPKLYKKYYKNLEYGVIAVVVGLIGALISAIGWYFKNPILIFMGGSMIILTVTCVFITVFYGFYLLIRLLFAKWTRRD